MKTLDIPPPSFGNKVLRLVWQLSYISLFRFSPFFLYSWRSAVLRLFGAKVGKNCSIYSSAKIWAPWNLETGNNVTIGPGVEIYNVARVVMENDVVISQRSFVCTASHNYNSNSFDLTVADIVLRENCWVAAEAFIAPGVILGHSSVALARSVIIKSVADCEVVAGNPARVIACRSKNGRNVLRRLLDHT